MPNLLPRLLPLLGLLAGSSGWLDGPQAERGLTFAVAANGMSIDPNGGNGPDETPVTIAEPVEPGLCLR